MEPVGLIAGQGAFPREVARVARLEGRRLVAVGLRELADEALAGEVDHLAWLFLGEFQRLFALFRAQGVSEVVMAGKVPKAFLWERPDALRPDALALAMMQGLSDRKDDSLLGGVAELIEEAGFRLLRQVELAPALVAPVGPLGARGLGPEEERDVAFAWPIAKALGGLDVGQSVVVQEGAVLALEAVEGTDAAITRGCALGARGRPLCVVKVAKPSQDPRFDVPLVGVETLRTMAAGGATALAVEAGATIVLHREELVREADEAGISVVGVRPAAAGAG